MFLGAQTQFRYAPDGTPSGLDYTGVRAYMAAVRGAVKYTGDDFLGLQEIEHSFLKGIREKKATDGNHDHTH